MSDRYLIFGGTGSLGRKLIERLLPKNEIAVFSRDEVKHWIIKNDFLKGDDQR
jgi:FlaA1/EpsC-like NDP-sugar epimerase